MAKYKNHEEFGAAAPPKWREETTAEVYLAGLSGIAPDGMKPKEKRGQRFREKTDEKASAKWHRNYDIAMFGGTDIPLPSSAAKQLDLEARIRRLLGERTLT